MRKELLDAGWRVLTVWECACGKKTLSLLAQYAEDFLRDRNRASYEIDGRLLREEMEKTGDRGNSGLARRDGG